VSDIERFEMLLARTGVGYPRGALGFEARSYAESIAAGDAGAAELLRGEAAEQLWPEFRLAMGAGLDRARGAGEDPTLDDALALVMDEDPANDLSLALVEEAGRSLAAVITRTDDRLRVLDERLAADGGGDEVVRTVGAIVIDLLDIDAEDYEEEIAQFIQAGEGEDARDALARATGDEEIRAWARDELEWITDGADGKVAHALAAMAHGEVPGDAAHDPVWVATVLALVEEAVEIVQVNEMTDSVEP